MTIAFIGAGGAGGIIIVLLVVFVLLAILITAIVCLAFRKKIVGSLLLLVFIALVSWIFVGTLPNDYREFSQTALKIQSDSGRFHTTADGEINEREFTNLRDSEFLLEWDGVELKGNAHATFVDLRRRHGHDIRYSVVNVSDTEALRAFLEEAFQTDLAQEENGEFTSGQFTFAYTTRIDGSLDFGVTKKY